LNLAVGSSFALASRVTLPHERLLGSVSLWALLGLEVLVFVPVGAYLLWRFPEWSYMYLAEQGTLGVPDIAVAGSYVIAGLLGWAVVRAFVVRGRTVGGVGFGIACLVLAGAIAGFGYEQLTMVGSTAHFEAGHGAMMPLSASPLSWVLIEAGLGVGAAWGWSLWRILLYGRAFELHELEGVVSVGTGDLEPVEPTQRRQRR
jgi:hypothetical protein